jgi:hypothetical protein
MSKIGFDMDGVLVPDYNKIPNLTDNEFYLQTLYAKPLFSPSGEFDVVTARFDDPEVRKITEQWCEQLAVAPQNVFMRPRGNETPAQFKYRISIEQGYTIYVESDQTVVDEMRQLVAENNVDLMVIMFAESVANLYSRIEESKLIAHW